MRFAGQFMTRTSLFRSVPLGWGRLELTQSGG
jgi:hypothetical protein